MNRITHTLQRWIRRTGHRVSRAVPESVEGQAYSLTGWPVLPETHRTAAVYRLMSVMTVVPVKRQWMSLQTGLCDDRLEDLLQVLAQQQVLEKAPASLRTG